jgi:D-amino peptidase
MEGISGVVDWEHVTPGSAEWSRFREIMTGDVNAAVAGCYEAGAERVLVSDAHSNGRNLLREKLDPRAWLNSGSASTWWPGSASASLCSRSTASAAPR